MKKILVLMTAIVSFGASANLSGFNDRFEFVKDEGKLVAVRDNSLSTNFSIRHYLNYIKDEILTEQALMSDKSATYDQDIKSLFGDENSLRRRKENKSVNHVVSSMRALNTVDFEAVFSNPEFIEVMEKFETKLKDVIFYIDPQLVAKPDNSTFFYKRNATYKVVSWALDFAAKRLSTIPLLNTASYAIKQIEQMIVKRRTYHQNMLLHYLELSKEEDLGLTKEEADSIFSSIYESRIDWYAFWESKSATRNWQSYGSSSFYNSFRLGTSKLRSARSSYTQIDQRHNFAFQEVVYKGERVIVNLFDSNNMFDSRPAIAFSYDNPRKIKRLRAVLTLARLGVSFVPLPALVKDIVHNYVKSYYEAQQITEGALMAHFEYTSDSEGMGVLKSQYINPFDQNL